jgi:hypothetical protein
MPPENPNKTILRGLKITNNIKNVIVVLPTAFGETGEGLKRLQSLAVMAANSSLELRNLIDWRVGGSWRLPKGDKSAKS